MVYMNVFGMIKGIYIQWESGRDVPRREEHSTNSARIGATDVSADGQRPDEQWI